MIQRDRIRDALELAERRAVMDGKHFTRFGFGVAVEQVFNTPLIPPELSDAILIQRGDVRLVAEDRYELLHPNHRRWGDVRVGILALGLIMIGIVTSKPDLLCRTQTRVCVECPK